MTEAASADRGRGVRWGGVAEFEAGKTTDSFSSVLLWPQEALVCLVSKLSRVSVRRSHLFVGRALGCAAGPGLLGVTPANAGEP